MFNDWQQALAAEELPLEATPEDELAAAARLTARNSRDKDDLALLLAAVGVPTDPDTITALLPLIPDPADPDTDPADTTGTTGDDPDMTTTVPEKTQPRPTAEEAMAVSMFFAHRHIGDIVEITGLSEQRIRHLADAAEAESDALQMAVEGRTTADIAAAVDLPEQKVSDLIDAAPITSAHPQAPAAADRDLVDAGTIGVLLAWAEKHDLASIRGRAARIRTDLAELSDRASTERATAEAEARVAKAKADLEAAQAELRAVKSGTVRPAPASNVVAVPAPTTPAADGKRSREELARIRVWARENGHQVGVAGIVKKTILDAYDAAHQAPAQAV
jgi:hypothetical protein